MQYSPRSCGSGAACPPVRLSMIRCLRVLPWLLLLLSALLSVHAVEPVPAPIVREPLPFVDASGVVEGRVPFSELIRVLGQADRDRSQRVARYRGGAASDELQTMEYLQRGLTFRIRRGETFDPDAPAESMVVEAPATARTPMGLFIGQEESEARALLSSHYRPVGEFRYSSSQQVTVKPLHGSRTLAVSFRDGRVSRMEFALQDPPWLSRSTRKFLGSLLMCGLLIGIGYLIARFRGTLPSAQGVSDFGDAPSGLSDGVRYVGALVLLFVGVLSAAFGIFTKGGSDGYALLLALVAMLAGAGCVLLMLLVLAGVQNRAVSLPAKVLAALVLLALVASKLFG